ncbi:aminotransferase class I/II-fold pyridoxal phosphate-dependent enzyme [Candidatus Pelagibacter sp. HIMB1587]|uniref:aminotransferase class I/II-fold pyridoxal phosphate-dependent enzyme n=1 Tax=Candidatus Pelagibacter sp. HIMB1587 TaxID=3413354 RepID=UPI003F8777A0
MRIPYNKQYIFGDTFKIISQSLKSDLITTGKYVKKFEQKIANFNKVKYALVTSSGTSALHLAFESINIKKGDNVIIPAINFIASYSMLKKMNANIFLADVDNDGHLSPITLVNCIKHNNLKKIKAVINMHMSGHIKYTDDLLKLKKKFNFFLINDSCHSFGSKYIYKKQVFNSGNCSHFDIATYSFHPVKSITTGEGGAITTNNKKIYKNIIAKRSHGIIRDKKRYWNYKINELGYNYRLSDLNCALGISQLNNLKKIMAKRKKIAKYYFKKLEKFSEFIDLPDKNLINFSSWHLFVIKFKSNLIKDKYFKDKVFNIFIANKIFPQYHYIPIYNFKAFAGTKKKLRGTENFYKSALSIPIYYAMKYKDCDKVIKCIKLVIKKFK